MRSLHSPFGHTLKLSLSFARPWLRLGPGWAMLAGALSTGQLEFNLPTLLRLIGLWLLVDPLLGMLWDISAGQDMWRKLAPANLPPPSPHGFSLPYLQPGSPAARLVIVSRRYWRWWRDNYTTEYGRQLATFWLGSALALLFGLFFGQTVFWLTILTLGLSFLAGQTSIMLAGPQGGRLQSLAQFLLPWAIGVTAWATLSPLRLALAVCWWIVYLGGLRMAGQHHQAGLLFWLGQATAIILLLELRLLPGAAVVGVLFIAQWLLKLKFNSSPGFLQKMQPYLVAAVLVAGWGLGVGG